MLCLAAACQTGMAGVPVRRHSAAALPVTEHRVEALGLGQGEASVLQLGEASWRVSGSKGRSDPRKGDMSFL